MNIGIIIHSQTGNTLLVAQKIQTKLTAAGHKVTIERIIPDDEKQIDTKKVNLQKIPDVNAYDALVVGGPVHGFNITPAMTVFLEKVPSLKEKKVAVLVTHQFPFAGLGGTQTATKIRNLCKAKNAVVCGEGIVNWGSKKREKTIDEIVNRFSKLF